MCGSTLSLSNGGTTVTKANTASAWNSSVLGSSRVPEFQVKIEETGHIMIGYAPSNGFQINGKNHNNCGYWMYSVTGNLYSAKDSGKLYFNRLSSGDIVTAIYNKEEKTISFEVNGNECGIAFTEVNEELYPAVELWGPGTVTFVM
ncbi:hypothetical protein HMI54_009381 [Coelomomyces lativittatus]|nr:hypothetical protein HMI54_009381 [Coelomomyces lativittatus]